MNAAAARELLERHHRALVLPGVLLLLVAAWSGASAYATPLVEHHVSRETAWTEEASFTYAVPVTRNSTLWPIGTVLPMGEPAYFRTISDVIHVNYTWAPATTDDAAQGIAAGRLSILIVAEARDGREYWRIERTLDELTTTNAADGLALSGSVDLDEYVNEVGVLQTELPAEGRVNWSVRANVVYAFDAHGRLDQGESERVLPIGASDPRFVLPAPDELAWSEAHAQESTRVVTRAAGVPGILSSWRILPLGALGAALLVAGVAFARAPGSEEFDREYRRYREWVSTAARVPDGSADAWSTIDVRSLEDLVHVAADARTRVVLDERSRVFYAFVPGATYRYARHAY